MAGRPDFGASLRAQNHDPALRVRQMLECADDIRHQTVGERVVLHGMIQLDGSDETVFAQVDKMHGQGKLLGWPHGRRASPKFHEANQIHRQLPAVYLAHAPACEGAFKVAVSSREPVRAAAVGARPVFGAAVTLK